MGFLHRDDGPGGTRCQMREKLFAIGDDYGIDIAPGQDDALIPAVTVCIDEMARG